MIFPSMETVALGQEDWERAARYRIDEKRRSSAASQRPGQPRTGPPDFELWWGYLFQFASPANSPLDLSPTPNCSAETGPSAPVAMALQHQPGQSGRRRVSEPLLLKPEQDTQPMGRAAEWSHHGNLSPEVPTGFSSPYLVCGGWGVVSG